MKKNIISLFLLISFSVAKSQIDKAIWLVGGSGSFSSTKNTFNSPNYSQTSDVVGIKISPNIGYFIFEKLAIGLRPSFSKDKAQVTTAAGGYTNVNRFEIGPFVRYYFLNKEKPYNILTDISYQTGLYAFRSDKGTNNTFSASVGPVIYFNSSVGLEFLLGYYRRNEKVKEVFETIQEGFQIGIGFQIHLEK